jgi:hypothetical protein
MRAIKVAMGVVRYVVLNCDEMFTIDNQSWLLDHYYVVQNWVRILTLIFLDKVFEGLSSDNPTKVIRKALIIGGGLQRNELYNKTMSFLIVKFN